MGETRARADVWLAQEAAEPEIMVVGVPWSDISRGVALAPMAMRERLGRFLTHHSERDVDLAEIAVSDAGNWPVSELGKDGLRQRLFERRSRLEPFPLVLYVGGDGGITFPLAADTTGDSRAGLIRFSKAPRDDTTGDGLSGQEVVLIGIHTFGSSAKEMAASANTGATFITDTQIEKEGVRMTVDRALGKLSLCETIHVSVDLDALDRAHAPSALGAIPGGLHLRQLSDAVRRCARSGKVRSMDFVGADAQADGNELTIDALCHVFLSAVTGYAERTQTP